jgi:multiple sugar transport system ATP-binding protein
MNVMPAKFVRAEPAHAVVEVEGVQVTVAVDARHVAPGSAVHLGVRPEHIEVGDSGAGAGLPVLLRHVERLGDVSLMYVDLGKAAPTVLTVRAEGSVRPPVGTKMTLRLLPERLHLFDTAGLACQRTVELPT